MTRTDVRRSLVSGSFWIALSEALKALAELASGIVAARVLAPADFGLIATVMLTIAVLDNFTRSGFDQALIQKQDDVEPYLNLAWTWQVVRGLALGLILCGAAPAIAAFYGEPALRPLIWVTSLWVVLQGLPSVGLVFFSRELKFRALFGVNVLQAAASAGITIPAVLYFENVWGLVVGLLASAMVRVALSFAVHPWRPRLSWDRGRFGELTRYGRWITGLSMVGFVVTQGDDIFVSKYVGLSALAFYQLAYSLSNLPATKITHVISNVSFPTYARLRREPEALKAAFLGVMRATMLMSAPLSVAIWLASEGIVLHVIGPKWAPILPLVHILVLAAFVRSFAAVAGALFQACERPDLDLKMNLPRLVIMLAMLWPMTAWRGLEGACLVVLLSIAGCLPVWFYGVRRLAGIGPLEALGVNMPAVALAAGLGALWLGWSRGLETLLGPSALSFALTIGLALTSWLLATRVLGRVWPAIDVVALVRVTLKPAAPPGVGA